MTPEIGLERVRDGRTVECIVDKGAVDGHVLASDQFDGLVGGGTSQEGADGVQLTATVTASDPKKNKDELVIKGTQLRLTFRESAHP